MTSVEARRAVRLAAILILLLCVAGIVGIRVIAKYEMWRRSIFYEQFAAIEAPAIAILAIFSIVVLALAARARDAEESLDPLPGWVTGTWATAPAIAIGALLVTAIGTWAVFHGYLFVDDEFSGAFQGVIYSRGQLTATVPQPWCQWIIPLTPTSISVPAECTWKLGYFPVNAMIRGAFHVIRADWFANPVMTALTILLVHNTVRRVWPERPERAVLAALFLAASTQVLLMTMTGFSMPAHLLASAAWLWLYVRPERWALVALPWLGVVALGVHSPYPHVLFVAPLVLSFLFQRRFAAFAYISVVYVIGALAWVGRLYPGDGAIAPPTASADRITATAVSITTSPAGDPMTSSMTTTVLATWNVPIALLCVLTALLLWNRLDRFARWLAISFLFTVLARAFISNTYGAGWGNRYAYAALANLAILAALGVEMLGDALGRRTAYKVVAAAFLVALVVELPMRSVQAARIVKPYYDASKYLESIPADVVVVQFEALQWGRQLLRNDPFLRNSPKMMSYSELKQSGIDSLELAFPGRVKVVNPAEIEALGVKRATRIGRFEIR